MKALTIFSIAATAALPLQAATTLLNISDPDSGWTDHVFTSTDGGDCGRFKAGFSGHSMAVGDTVVMSLDFILGSAPLTESVGALRFNDSGSPSTSLTMFTINDPSATYNTGTYSNDGSVNMPLGNQTGTNPLVVGNAYSLSYSMNYSALGEMTINTVLIDQTAGSTLLNTTDGNPSTGDAYVVALPGLDPSNLNITFGQESIVCIKDPVVGDVIPEPSRALLLLMGMMVCVGSRKGRR